MEDKDNFAIYYVVRILSTCPTIYSFNLLNVKILEFSVYLAALQNRYHVATLLWMIIINSLHYMN